MLFAPHERYMAEAWADLLWWRWGAEPALFWRPEMASGRADELGAWVVVWTGGPEVSYAAAAAFADSRAAAGGSG